MMKETIHLAIYDTMADWEVGYAIAHLNSPEFQKTPGRFEVKTVGSSLAPIVSKGGLRIVPDLSLHGLKPQDSRMLILPGSDNAAIAGMMDGFVEMAAQFLSAGIPVAAICGATAALARGGLLDALPHTSNARGFLDGVGYKGAACYQDQLAVTAGNLITASGIAPIEFAVEIFRKLDVYSDATLRSWHALFKNQDPAGFYELMAEHSGT